MLPNNIIESTLICKICSVPLVTPKNKRNKKYCDGCKIIALQNQKRIWDINKRATPYKLNQFYSILKITLKNNPYIICH